MKNAGKACNNRLYRHIRTFEKIIKNYFVIYYEILENKLSTFFIPHHLFDWQISGTVSLVSHFEIYQLKPEHLLLFLTQFMDPF